MADNKPLPKLNKAVLDGGGNGVRVNVINSSLEVALNDKQNKLLEELVVVVTNMSENLFLIADKIGAQLVALTDTRQAFLNAFKVDEGKAAEDRQEAKQRKEIKEKQKNPFQRIIDFFDTIFNVLIPYLIGVFIGIKKEFALIAALVLVFRKQVFAVLKELPKVVAGLVGAGKNLVQGIIKGGQALVSGLSKAFYFVYSNLLKSIDFVKKLGPAIAESATKFRVSFPKIFEKFAKIGDTLTDAVKSFKKFGLVGAVTELIQDAVKMFVKAKDFILTAPGKILKAATNAFRFILIINAKMIQTVVEFFAKVKNFFSGPSKLIEVVVTKVSQVFFKFYSAMLKVGEVFARLKDALQPITKLFAGPADGVAKAAASAGKQVGVMSKALNFVTQSVSKIVSAFGKVGEIGKLGKGLGDAFKTGANVLSKVGSLFSSFGKLLGPIGVAISIVTSLFKGIKQAFKGFDEEGIFGAIKGFTSGIISGFFGWIGDLGSWVIGKLLKLLGFEELGDKVASLDFTEMLNQTIMNLFDNIKTAFTDMFSSLTEGFQNIFSGEDIIGGIIDVMMAIPNMLIDLITSPFKALGESLKEVFNFDIGDIVKRLADAILPPGNIITDTIRKAIGLESGGGEAGGKAVEGKPAAKPAAAKPAAGKPAAAAGEEESSLERKKRLLAQMEKSGNKAGAASLRASIEKDESLQRLAGGPSAQAKPAKTKPAAQPAQAKPAGDGESSLEKKKRLLAQMEKSGNKAGAASLRASIEKDESLQRLGGQPAVQPVKPAPAKQEAKPIVQPVKPAPNQPYSGSDLDAAKRNLAMAEKSGSKAAISAARSRVEKMESMNKVADAAVKPVPTAPNGAAINQQSQAVAGAQGTAKGAGSSQNVVAPVTTTNVNNSSSQNLSVKPQAVPMFGIQASGRQPAVAF